VDFLLGTHEISWLARGPSFVRWFISAVRLRRQKKMPLAIAPWALDSGAFSEIALHGRWTIPPAAYVAEVRRWRDVIGLMLWAAIQDWMCEPTMLAKTGKTVREHQWLTLQSYLELMALAPDIDWLPVVQGWTVEDYLHHVEMYLAEGIDLRTQALVGVGSVCKRQGTHQAGAIMRELQRVGLRLHAFGVKTDGLAMFGDRIASADSMAWSYVARRRNHQLSGHTHKTCSNCREYAVLWRERLLGELGDKLAPMRQQEMPW
jgi:hypothetical protein